MAEGGKEAVLRRKDGAVTELILNRPDRLNAIDDEVAAQLLAELKSVRDDPHCRCLVITGTGRGFCSGQALPTADGAGVLPQDIAQLIQERYVQLITLICEMPLPVVAAVNGVAAGAGFSLALAADLRVVSDEASFSCAFAKIGLVPDSGASFFLPRYLGYPRALELALTGGRIDVRQAVEFGLVARVFPASTFSEDYRAFTKELASGPTRAYALTKRALAMGQVSALDAQLALEAALQQEASETADFAEGLRAFLEKRAPRFTGH